MFKEIDTPDIEILDKARVSVDGLLQRGQILDARPVVVEEPVPQDWSGDVVPCAVDKHAGREVLWAADPVRPRTIFATPSILYLDIRISEAALI